MSEITFYDSTGSKVDSETGAVVNSQSESIRTVLMSGLKLGINPYDREVIASVRAEKVSYDRAEEFVARFQGVETNRPLMLLHSHIRRHLNQWGFKHSPVSGGNESIFSLMESPTERSSSISSLSKERIHNRLDEQGQISASVGDSRTAMGILSANAASYSVAICEESSNVDLYHDIIVSVSSRSSTDDIEINSA